MTYVALSFISWLEEMLNEIINSVLAPVLKTFLYISMQFLFGICSAFVYRLLMRCFVILLKVVYIVEQIFDIFACTRGVYVFNEATKKWEATTGFGNSVMEQDSLLDVLMRYDVLTRVVLRITLAAFVLCFLFTLFAVIKSVGDSLGENKKPVSHVLKATTKACLYFVLIPITVLFSVKVIGACTSAIVTYIPQNMYGKTLADTGGYAAINEASKSGGNSRTSSTAGMEKAAALARLSSANSETRICDVIFYVCCGPAFRSDEARQYYASGQNFQNFDQVVEDVDITIVNYPLALIFVVMMLLVLLVLILQCIIRIFALLTLYVVSPYFVAMIPLDDGQKFKRWREMFVAFSVSTFGPIISMRFYLSLVAFVAVPTSNGEGINFGTGNVLTELICLVIFIVGGAYAVWKSQDLMVSAVDPEAASTLQKSMMLMTFAMNKITGGISDTVQKGLSQASGDKKK